MIAPLPIFRERKGEGKYDASFLTFQIPTFLHPL
jgi:hypothetical protein